jgi:hypothetical protein
MLPELRKRYFLIIFLFVLSFRSFAQYNDVGILVGGSNYKGELSPHLFNKDFIHFAGGVFFRHNWNRHWSYKFELNYAQVSGDDALGETGYAVNRNLSFHSEIMEFSPQIEFNFFPYETASSDFRFSPYLFTGISIFHFNPEADLNGKTYELQPMGTEGQGINGTDFYNRVTFALPIGGGIKVSLGNIGIGIEVGARRTYTDYLDDVSTYYPDQLKLIAARGLIASQLSDRSLSIADNTIPVPTVTNKQRGNPQDNDWYLIAGLSIYFRLTSSMGDVCAPFKKKKY